MQNKILIAFIALLVFGISFFSNQSLTYSWGFFGHQRINRMAVFTLPSSMIGFYKTHLEFITEHAVDPDKRRYAVKGEAPRHHIDLDHYGDSALVVVPHYWKRAIEKYTEDTLMAYGIVPWHTEKMLNRLTQAFKERNVDKILRNSADLGHYIADGHVPLHTTENYNGQMTNQKGIHGFWESRIPELKALNWNYFVGKAYYVDNTNKFIWAYITDSFLAHDSVLTFEKILNDKTPSDQKYCIENRGRVNTKTYCESYATDFDNMLNGQVERRMRNAVLAVGCLWYTAWVNAGQPDLNKLINREPSDSLKNQLQTEEEQWKNTNHIPTKGHAD
ncbi:MAG: S1/P1 Nuclease [Bacteroidia bacterium]|nr:S1/P1 Nuclease [Bacteroidia bacterium]